MSFRVQNKVSQHRDRAAYFKVGRGLTRSEYGGGGVG